MKQEVFKFSFTYLTVYFRFRRSSRQNHTLLHVARRSYGKQLRTLVELFRNSKTL